MVDKKWVDIQLITHNSLKRGPLSIFAIFQEKSTILIYFCRRFEKSIGRASFALKQKDLLIPYFSDLFEIF